MTNTPIIASVTADPVRRRLSPLAVAMMFVFAVCFMSPMLLSHFRASPDAALATVLNKTGPLTGHLGDTLQYRFDIANISPQPIRILGTQSSCGCTAVADELPRAIGPGETTTLTVRVVLGETTGVFSRSVRLLVNRSGSVPLMTVTAETLP